MSNEINQNKKPWYEDKFNDWLFAKKKKSNTKQAPLTDEQKEELAKLNGGWYQDELFIPMMTKRESMLRYTSTWKAIWFFCLPTIILTVIQGLYNIVDKSLSLAFVTPHAVENIQYIQYMIMGQNGAHSILLDTINGYIGILNHDDIVKIATELFNITPGTESYNQVINYVQQLANIKGNGTLVFDNSTSVILTKMQSYIIDNHVNISSDKIQQYINVATQYTVQSYNIVLAFTKLMAIGAGMHYSVEFGRRNKNELKVIAGNGMTYSAIMSILVGVLLFGISFRPWGQVLISSQMGGSRNLIVEQLAWEDVEPLIYGITAVFIAELTMNMLRSEGKMVSIMIMTISSLGVKLLTSILLMKYTSLEMTGAQLGTILSYAYQLIYCLIVMFFSKVTYSNFRFKDLYQLRWSNFIYTIKSGFPNFINYFSFVVNGYVSTALVVRLPMTKDMPSIEQNGQVSILQEMISALTPWNEFILSACVGLNQGVRSMIAYNYGAEKNERILEILKRSSWLMFGWFVFIFVLILSAGPGMLELFKFPGWKAQVAGQVNYHLDNGIKYGNIFYDYMILYFMTYPLACFTYISLGLYQGTKRNVAATISTSLRALVIYVPMTVIGWAVARATSNPIWYFVFMGLTDLVASFILVPMLYAFYKRAKYSNSIVNSVDDLLTLASYDKLKIDTDQNKLNKLLNKDSKKSKLSSVSVDETFLDNYSSVLINKKEGLKITKLKQNLSSYQNEYDTRIAIINKEHKTN